MKTLKQIREASGGKEAYQKFFNSLLKKFGVDSPSELEGKKKKDFFDAIDKGWEGSGEKDEATIYLPNELTEKLKAGSGAMTSKNRLDVDFDWGGAGGNSGVMDIMKKYKIKINPTRDGAEVQGPKANILKFLQGDEYGMDDMDIEDLFPELLEAVDCDARLMGFKASVRRKEGEKQKGRVLVDRRTKGAKAATLRSEKAKAKREEKRKQKEFAEKYPKLDYQYGNDADLAEILYHSNKKLFGETAANSSSSGNVDMAPNAGKKKKKKEGPLTRYGH
jgi:hypothetical protein